MEIRDKIYDLYIYYDHKVGWEKWKYIKTVLTNDPQTEIVNGFTEQFGKLYRKGVVIKPEVKKFDATIKINGLRYNRMYVAFKNSMELVFAENPRKEINNG